MYNYCFCFAAAPSVVHSSALCMCAHVGCLPRSSRPSPWQRRQQRSVKCRVSSWCSSRCRETGDKRDRTAACANWSERAGDVTRCQRLVGTPPAGSMSPFSATICCEFARRDVPIDDLKLKERRAEVQEPEGEQTGEVASVCVSD